MSRRIKNELTKLLAYNPFVVIDVDELDEMFAMFMTLIWLVKDKKITKTTFFIELVETVEIRDYLKYICGIETDMELYREILSRSPTICSSKLIRNKLQSIHQ